MFKEMTREEMMMIDGGSWSDFADVLTGTLGIAVAPIYVVSTGDIGGAIDLVSTGWDLITRASGK